MKKNTSTPLSRDITLSEEALDKHIKDAENYGYLKGKMDAFIDALKRTDSYCDECKSYKGIKHDCNIDPETGLTYTEEENILLYDKMGDN